MAPAHPWDRAVAFLKPSANAWGFTPLMECRKFPPPPHQLDLGGGRRERRTRLTAPRSTDCYPGSAPAFSISARPGGLSSSSAGAPVVRPGDHLDGTGLLVFDHLAGVISAMTFAEGRDIVVRILCAVI
jgi:hypothetical protein